MNLADLFCAGDPRRPALLFDERVYSRGEMEALSNQVAHALIALGVRPGDVVCQAVGNTPDLIINVFGALKTGATYAPLNPSLTEQELAVQLDDCRPAVVITEARLADKVERAAAGVAGCRVITTEALAAAGASRPRERPRCEIDPDGPRLLFYTSGTSGRPKGVQLSHANVLANARQVGARTGVGPEDRLLVVMPIFHVNGFCNQIVLAFLAGASIVLRPRFVLETFWQDVARYRPSYFTAVPTLLTRLVEAGAPPASLDLGSLRFVRTGAAPLTVELQRRFEARFGWPLISSYGMTEATCTATMNPPTFEGRRLGSVGTALEGMSLRILDAGGRPLPPGKVGEVALKGPTLMIGYRGMPEATAEAIPDGWLRTGDLGYLDSDGYLFLTDRKKEIIIRGGENISPREIEETLYAHPDVVEAAVVGAPDPEYGEQVVAFVVPRNGAGPAFKEGLLAHCRERLARFKVPARIETLDSMPKNATGKILKPELRRLAGAS